MVIFLELGGIDKMYYRIDWYDGGSLGLDGNLEKKFIVYILGVEKRG